MVWGLIVAASICLTAVSFDVANAIPHRVGGDPPTVTSTSSPAAATPDSRTRYAIYFRGINGELSTAGLLQAHRTSDVEGVIRVDCQSSTHESCQFYLYQYSVDTVQHGMKETQTLYRFESVKYAEYYLYWDGFTDNVFLRNFTGKDCELESISNVRWVLEYDRHHPHQYMLRESESCYAAIPPYVMFVDNEDMRGGCECSSTCQCSNGVTPQLTSSRDSAINSGGIHFYNMDYYD